MTPKLKVIESSEMDENEASPMLLRLSFGTIPVCSSRGSSVNLFRKAVCPCAEPHLMSQRPMTTEATMPTVAAVMASESISSMPYLPKASPMAAAVPCPPQNPLGIESPKASFSGQIIPSSRSPATPPNAHCNSSPACA